MSACKNGNENPILSWNDSIGTQNLCHTMVSIIPIGSPTCAQKKCSGESHMHVENPIHLSMLRYSENVPNAPMVPPPQTSTNHIEPIEDKNIKPKTFSTNGI